MLMNRVHSLSRDSVHASNYSDLGLHMSQRGVGIARIVEEV